MWLGKRKTLHTTGSDDGGTMAGSIRVPTRSDASGKGIGTPIPNTVAARRVSLRRLILRWAIRSSSLINHHPRIQAGFQFKAEGCPARMKKIFKNLRGDRLKREKLGQSSEVESLPGGADAQHDETTNHSALVLRGHNQIVPGFPTSDILNRERLAEKLSVAKLSVENVSTASAFTGASNITLDNVQVNTIGRDMYTTVHIHHGSGNGMNVQEALGYLPNPRGSSWDPAHGCLAGTRMQHLEEIYSWISVQAGPTSAGSFVVADAAGSGKSALLHTTCQHLHKQGLLLAGFFFDKNGKHGTTANLFATIVRGLCAVHHSVKLRIAELISDDNTLAIAPITRQFEELILQVCPLLPPNRIYVVAIDALDEGYDVGLLKFLRDSVTRLPPSFRFILTTRPEKRILQYLENQPHIHMSSRSLTGESSLLDLDVYIRSRVAESSFASDVTPELIEGLVNKSEGVFLWAATVLNFLEEAYDPIAELRDIVCNNSDAWREDKDATKKLDSLYARILSGLRWSDKRFVAMYQAVVGGIVTVKKPLSARGLAELYRSEGVTMDDVVKICGFIRPLLRISDLKDPTKPIRVVHLSVQEYLTDRAPTVYRLSPDDQNFTICKVLFGTIQASLTSPTTPVLGYSTSIAMSDDIASHIPTLPKLFKQDMPEHLWYSYSFLCDHVLETAHPNFGQSDLTLIRDVIFVNSRALLEVTAAMGAVVDFGVLENWAWAGIFGEPENLDYSLLRGSVQSLHAVSLCLFEADRRQEAHRILFDAIDLYNTILDSGCNDPDFKMDMAHSLHLLAQYLAKLGRADNAVRHIQEAVRITRQLAEADSPRFEPVLFQFIRSSASFLADASLLDEALEVCKEAVDFHRRSGVDNPAELARSLLQLAATHFSAGRDDDALEVAGEAVQLLRRLAEEDLVGYGLQLAVALSDSYCVYLGFDDPARIVVMEEALSVQRRLMGEDMARFAPSLTASLGLYACDLTILDRHAEALKTNEEAVGVQRRLVGDMKDCDRRHLERLSSLLGDLSASYSTQGRGHDAVKTAREKLEIARTICQGDRSILEDEGLGRAEVANEFMWSQGCLAFSLTVYARFLSEVGRLEEAIESSQDALAIFRQKAAAKDSSSTDQHELAFGLRTLAGHMGASKRYEEAVILAKEEVELHRDVLVAERLDMLKAALGVDDVPASIEDIKPPDSYGEACLKVYLDSALDLAHSQDRYVHLLRQMGGT
ncbi:hypothetical protein FA15DRAFT_308096 [Coprinopsis marcescibilis]|uniref:Nephrocystin 3-like N-terminal domain-containing protein n=1 Tax=Coprinopsis marcescibilis TaxID=230819 RepID=A0A5C3KCX4_COPMA|nr:hypothetical protein FA15DRAFT_308096 [Coprinopsis marcescibilis]